MIIITVVSIMISLDQVNIDDGLLDEVFEDLPGNSQAKSQPAPRSPSKVACSLIIIIQMMIMTHDHNYHHGDHNPDDLTRVLDALVVVTTV